MARNTNKKNATRTIIAVETTESSEILGAKIVGAENATENTAGSETKAETKTEAVSAANYSAKNVVFRPNKSDAIVGTVSDDTDLHIRNAARPQTKALFRSTVAYYKAIAKDLKLPAPKNTWNVRDLVAEFDAATTAFREKNNIKAVRRLVYFVSAYQNRIDGCYTSEDHGSQYDNTAEFEKFSKTVSQAEPKKTEPKKTSTKKAEPKKTSTKKADTKVA